jgi:ferredoxin
LPAAAGQSIRGVEDEKTMKITVDFDVCQSHGLCTEAAPEVFEIRDDGFLYILNETPPDALRAKIERATRECPTGAIKVEG